MPIEGCWKGGGVVCWDGELGDTSQKPPHLQGWPPADTVVLLIGMAQPPPDRQRRKKRVYYKENKVHFLPLLGFPILSRDEVPLCICWPKGGSIRSTTSRFAAFAAAMTPVVLAAVNWYLLKAPGPDINYFFLENFRVNYTLILGAFYEGKKNEAYVLNTSLSGDLNWNL